MRRILLIAVCLPGLLIANYVYGVTHYISRDYDYAYIATHCARIRPDQAADIAAHITYDASIGGNLYIFDQVSGQFSKDDFEAATRGPLSEFLCFPVVGCLTPPHLSEDCSEEG